MIGDKKIVALCIGRISDYSSYSFIEELADCLWEMNAKLFVYCTCTDMYFGKDSEVGEEAVFSLIDYNVVDALVLLGDRIKRPDVKARILNHAREHKVPIVVAMEEYDDTYNVVYDERDGFEQLIRHVMDVHQPEKVHFIAGLADSEVSRIRESVFREVMAEYGRCVSDDMIGYGDFWSVPAEKVVLDLIHSNRVPDAIICANDVMAITACDVLQKNGFRVPEDVIVTGYDGIEDIYYSVPQITSCGCDYVEIAKAASEVLAQIFQEDKQVCSKKLRPRMLLSQSCGCGRGVVHNLAMYQDKLRNTRFFLEEREQRLSEVSSAILMVEDVKEAAGIFCREKIQDIYCILTLDCLNEEVDPFEIKENALKHDEMVLFYDVDEEAENLPGKFRKSQIIPDLEGKMKDKAPIFFFSLYFLKSALGYVCFYFKFDDKSNYTKVSQTINFLNNTINSFRNVRHQKYLMKKIESMYRTDGLTHLLNRNAFYKEYANLIENMSEKDTLTILLADLNGLKRINDVYGHNEGDNAIRVVADSLVENSPKGALICRYGGDELLMVTGEEVEVMALKGACQQYIAHYNETSDKQYIVSASMGICRVLKSEIADFEQLVLLADREMYREKENKQQE